MLSIHEVALLRRLRGLAAGVAFFDFLATLAQMLSIHEVALLRRLRGLAAGVAFFDFLATLAQMLSIHEVALLRRLRVGVDVLGVRGGDQGEGSGEAEAEIADHSACSGGGVVGEWSKKRSNFLLLGATLAGTPVEAFLAGAGLAAGVKFRRLDSWPHQSAPE